MHTNPANQKFNELCFNLLVLNHPPLHSSVEKPSLLSPGFIHTFERERGGGGRGVGVEAFMKLPIETSRVGPVGPRLVP